MFAKELGGVCGVFGLHLKAWTCLKARWRCWAVGGVCRFWRILRDLRWWAAAERGVALQLGGGEKGRKLGKREVVGMQTEGVPSAFGVFFVHV